MQKLAAFLKRFHSGPAADAYEYLGCHMHEDGEGYVFRVWAPHAQAVCVVGDFNFWNTDRARRPHGLQDRPLWKPLPRPTRHLQHD